MELTGLFIYPIKGLGAISLEKAYPLERGLEHDRRWMLVDEENQFLTQRTFHQFPLYHQKLHPEGISISYKNDSIIIPFDESAYKTSGNMQVWNDQVHALIADKNINNWFSKKLDFPCKLVYQSKNSIRMTDAKYGEPCQVSFADGYPYLMISEESLEFLNQQLNQPVRMDRFRPNFVIKGNTAHVEDQFELFRIGEFLFRGVKPCARCQVPNIDQATGIIGKEPVRTLASYRLFGNKILFGQNLIIEKEEGGTSIKKGDTVICLKEKVEDN